MFGVSDSLVKTFLSQENNKDLRVPDHLCFSELWNLSRERQNQINPVTYSLRTLRTFLALTEEKISYDYSLNWTNLGMMQNGRFSIPKTSEYRRTEKECSLLDILEEDVQKKIFSVQGSVGKNNVTKIKQVGKLIDGGIDNPNRYRVYDPSGIRACLTSQQGGGIVPSTVIKLPSFCDMSYGAGLDLREDCSALLSRYHKGISNRRRETTGICVPVLTPDRVNKRQDGRRFKENGDPMFTLTSQDKHGVVISAEDVVGFINYGDNETHGGMKVTDNCQTIRSSNSRKGIVLKSSDPSFIDFVWSERYNCNISIRRLTPLECFRLQGWDDKYFERAKSVNSDSQLYKQAGNGVTVNVIQAIAEKMGLEVDE